MHERRVDHSAIRVNQAFIIVLLAAAFVLDWLPLVGFVGGVMWVGTIWPGWGLFKRIYRHLLRPAGIVKPDVIIDHPEPHRFAQGVGAVFVTLGLLALLGSYDVVGWTLVGIVVLLANLNLWAGWCAGCTMYYWLNRWGVPGFDREPMEASR